LFRLSLLRRGDDRFRDNLLRRDDGRVCHIPTRLRSGIFWSRSSSKKQPHFPRGVFLNPPLEPLGPPSRPEMLRGLIQHSDHVQVGFSEPTRALGLLCSGRVRLPPSRIGVRAMRVMRATVGAVVVLAVHHAAVLSAAVARPRS